MEFCTSKWAWVLVCAIYTGQSVGYYREGNDPMGFVLAMYALSCAGFWWSRA